MQDGETSTKYELRAKYFVIETKKQKWGERKIDKRHIFPLLCQLHS